MPDSYLLEGLQRCLERLEGMRLEYVGSSADETPMVCAECYSPQDECNCAYPLYWPLPSVVYKLRSELGVGVIRINGSVDGTS